MPKKLVIVESPSKTKPIEKYLGGDYKVLSSKGHVRDLSTKGKYGFGVDIENDFKPDYIPMKGKTAVINELKKEAKKADRVYLATDPDREGEAISWHLFDTLGLKEDSYDRVVFNEITHDAVIEAFKNTRKIDKDLVNSQETRRILDRIIGFRLSKLIQSKTDGSSAGRVQSVALKLIVDREREIEAFKAEEYWTITGIFPSYLFTPRQFLLIKFRNLFPFEDITLHIFQIAQSHRGSKLIHFRICPHRNYKFFRADSEIFQIIQPLIHIPVRGTDRSSLYRMKHFRRMKTKNGQITKRGNSPSLVRLAKSMRRVINHFQIISGGNLLYSLHITYISIYVDRHDGNCFLRDQCFYFFLIDRKILFDVTEHRHQSIP